MLLAVIVAWLSAMLTRVPRRSGRNATLLVPGAIAAFFTLAGAWIAFSNRRWWMRYCCSASRFHPF